MKLKNCYVTLLLALLVGCGAKSKDSGKHVPVPEPGSDPKSNSKIELLKQRLAQPTDTLNAPADIVVCESHDKIDKGNSVRVETVEEFENRSFWKFDFALESQDAPAPVRAARMLKRIEKFDKLRSDRLYNQVIGFFDRIEYFSGEKMLASANSAAAAALPNGCTYAALSTSQDSKEKIFLNRSYWDKMSEGSRTLYILRKTLEKEIEDETELKSVKARYFVSFLAGNALPQTEKVDYSNFLKLLSVSPAMIYEHSLALVSDTAEFDNNGNLKSAEIAADGTLTTDYGTVLKLQKNDKVWFGADGKLEKAKVSAPVTVKILTCTFQVTNTEGFEKVVTFHSNGMVATGRVRDVCLQYGSQVKAFFPISGDVSFFATGVFKKGCMEVNDILPVAGTSIEQVLQYVAFQGQEEATADDCQVEMHSNGFVKRGVLHEEATLTTVKGEIKKYPARARLSFDETGRVVDFE